MEDFVTNVDPLILAIAMIILPLVFNIINSVKWPAAVKTGVAGILTLALGVGMAYAMGMETFEAAIATGVGLYVGTQTIRNALWKPLGVDDALTRRILPRS